MDQVTTNNTEKAIYKLEYKLIIMEYLFLKNVAISTLGTCYDKFSI